jgi:hypothetical protein
MSIQIRLIICLLLIIIAACMAGIVIGQRGGEDNRLKAEAFLTKAKTDFEKVKNELPKELINLVGISFFLIFLLTFSAIALLAYFIHRILNHPSEQRIILQITREQSEFQLSHHEHVRIVNGQNVCMPEKVEQLAAKKREEAL